MILNHRGQWWLAEFPQPGAGPAAIHRLTGQLTAAMIEKLAANGSRADEPYKVGPPYPSGLCWSGRYCLIPSLGSPDIFDVDACFRAVEADTPELRFVRIIIETLLFPLPSDFVSVLTALPKNNRPVLAIRLSGYVCSTFELLTARYMPVYRPLSPWRNISNDAVGDSGSDILGWRYADDWIKPS